MADGSFDFSKHLQRPIGAEEEAWVQMQVSDDEESRVEETELRGHLEDTREGTSTDVLKGKHIGLEKRWGDLDLQMLLDAL